MFPDATAEKWFVDQLMVRLIAVRSMYLGPSAVSLPRTGMSQAVQRPHWNGYAVFQTRLQDLGNRLSHDNQRQGRVQHEAAG